MDDKRDKSSVGYKNPPVHSRFQKGKSGNPSGRAKGSKNFKTVWNEAMSQPVTVNENGVSRQVDVVEAAILALKNEAISKLNLRAIFKLIDYSRENSDEDVASSKEDRLRTSEADILKRFEQDILKQHGVFTALGDDARASGVG